MGQRSVFLSGYDKKNLQISKDNGVLGCKQNNNKNKFKIGDYVFIYNITDKQIESVFEIESIVDKDQDKPIWKEENKRLIIFKNRWNVKLIQDNLNIRANEIAVFDAKNYGALSTSGGASHKMLAYITNLDVGLGILFFPNFPTKEYKFPREKDDPVYHFNLLLGHYNLCPQSRPETIEEKIKSITRIHLNLFELIQSSNKKRANE